MITTLAAEPVFLMSVIKPLFIAAMVIAWARWATFVDKDAEYFHLPRRMFNAINLAAGGVALLLWLVIPFFIVGLILFPAIVAGAGFAYSTMRNKKVPESARWNLSIKSFTKQFDDRKAEAIKREISLKFLHEASRTSSSLKELPDIDDENFETHAQLDALFNAMVFRNAQRIDMAISGAEAVVKLSIDGVSYRHAEQPTPLQALAMIDYLKAQCELDPAERRKKQVGETRFELGAHGFHQIRLTAAGSTRGVTCMIELDPHEGRTLDFEKLGFNDSQAAQVKQLVSETDGLVIVASPPRSGRTTTLYGLLSEHDPYLMDIQTLEDPIEADVEGITQHTPEQTGWAKSLNTLLLRDPSVVMVGQLTDKETAVLASKAAADGKRMYIGMPADDAFTALRGWLGAVGDLELASKSVRAVICQKLVRKLCPVCRVAYKPDPAALKKLNLPADRIDTLYKSSGKQNVNGEEQTCPTCAGIGYLGRSAVYEMIMIDDDDRPFIAAGDLKGLRTAQRKKKMLLMQESGLSKVVAGETSITELMRALGEQSAGAAKSGGAK